MKRIKLTDRDISGLYRFGVCTIFAEIDELGKATREIGLDASGSLYYKYPGMSRLGIRGILDGASFDVPSLEDDISEDEFNRLFSKTTQ